MAQITSVELPWSTVHSVTTASVFLPSTPFMDARQLDKLRGILEVRGLTGLLTIALAYQTANVENSVDTATAFSSTASADGVTFPAGGYTNVAIECGTKRLVRLGFVVSLSAGTTFAAARVRGSVDTVSR